MVDLKSAAKVCLACNAALTADAKFCPQCGKSADQSRQESAAQRVKWYYNAWFVLVMLFFVLGPFGLPLVWKNPRFSRLVKIALTLITIAYTLWLIQLTFIMARAILQGVSQFNSTLQF
jgi:predicted nucleic acid-binding Zn ribbon protein